MNETLNVYTNNHWDPGPTAIIMALLALSIVALWLFCLVHWRRALRAAADAKAFFESNSALRDGARFVSGQVEYAEKETLAVRVTVTQHGHESVGKHTSHTWTEVERKVEHRPFYLRTKDGQRVRIEAGSDAGVLLVDKLDKEDWTSKTVRKRRAELDPGETAFAEGILRQKFDPESPSADYRSPGTGWVLVPLARKIHVSTESLAERHLLRARAFWFALFKLPLLAVLALLPLSPFFARAAFGEDTRAQYYGRYFYETRSSKGKITPHWSVRASRPGERVQVIEVDRSDYERSLPELGWSETPYELTVWVRYINETSSFNTLGRGNTVHFGWWCLSAALVVALGAWVAAKDKHKRWYERALIESKDGLLPSPSGRTFDR